MTEPLAGRRIVVAREEPGELTERLTALGAEVTHVPLIAAADPPDGGAAFRAALDSLDRYDWLIVTSPNGARRIAVSPGPATKLAAVGRATAEALARTVGRPADLVPPVQRLHGLLEVFPPGDGRVLAVRGDLADPALVGGLQRLGWEVDDIVAYRTVAGQPTDVDRQLVGEADAVVFASGSAAASWATAFDGWTPGEVISIGPSTTVAAERAGLTVTAEAATHDVEGLVAATVDRLAR